jgi:hypothetical protein
MHAASLAWSQPLIEPTPDDKKQEKKSKRVHIAKHVELLPTLFDIDLNVARGQLIAIVGKVCACVNCVCKRVCRWAAASRHCYLRC